MVGERLSMTPITTDTARRIGKFQRVVNKGALYTTGVALLTLAAESLYRNLRGSSEVADYMFQGSGYALLGAGVTALFNNCSYGVISSDNTNDSNEDGLEGRLRE